MKLNRQQNRRGPAPVNSFKTAGLLLALCVVLGGGTVSVPAADTPAQATSRPALELKPAAVEHPQPAPAPQTRRIPRGLRLPVSTTPSVLGVKVRRLYAANEPVFVASLRPV